MKEPHCQKQYNMITFPGSVVALCGRRFGKTDAYVQRIYYHMLKKPGLYWWVGLTWTSASMKRAWREVCDIARQIFAGMNLPERNYINKSKYEIRIPKLGEIWFRTADNESSLAGEGIQGAVLDEFSLMKQTVWTEYIEATLLDHKGWAAFSGVPKGHNWAANLWHSAKDRSDWLQIHATTYDNPYIDPAEIDKIRYESNTPELFFNQEYLAQIIDDAGMVFRCIMDAVGATPQEEAIDGHEYVIGVDLAKHNDYTVLTVLDLNTNEVVYIDRFSQIDLTLQLQRLIALYERFDPMTVYIEINFNEMFAEQAEREGLHVTEFRTNQASKTAGIELLAVAFERGEIKIINDDILISELMSYQMERLPSGMMRYNAPSGMHDDCVMSLMLAWQATDILPALM